MKRWTKGSYMGSWNCLKCLFSVSNSKATPLLNSSKIDVMQRFEIHTTWLNSIYTCYVWVNWIETWTVILSVLWLYISVAHNGIYRCDNHVWCSIHYQNQHIFCDHPWIEAVFVSELNFIHKSNYSEKKQHCRYFFLIYAFFF